MGELINLNATVILADSDIPPAIARDAEYQAADAAHVAAVDPHPVYLTQAEGDARYGQGVLWSAAISIPLAAGVGGYAYYRTYGKLAKVTIATTATLSNASAIPLFTLPVSFGLFMELTQILQPNLSASPLGSFAYLRKTGSSLALDFAKVVNGTVLAQAEFIIALS